MARAELSRGGELADVCPADRAAYLSCRFALHRRQTHASPIHTYSRNLKSEFILRRYLSPNTCRGSDISTSTCCRGAERRVGKFEQLPLEEHARAAARRSRWRAWPMAPPARRASTSAAARWTTSPWRRPSAAATSPWCTVQPAIRTRSESRSRRSRSSTRWMRRRESGASRRSSCCRRCRRTRVSSGLKEPSSTATSCTLSLSGRSTATCAGSSSARR